MMLKWIGKSEH